MENYTHTSTRDQLDSRLPENYQPGQLVLNSALPNFIQLAPAIDDVTLTRSKEKVEDSVSGVTLVESGITHDSNNPVPEVCPECGAPLNRCGTRFSYVTHLPMGSKKIVLHVKKQRYRCTSCGFSTTENIPYQEEEHKITPPDVHLHL
jgi:transposase